MDSLGKSWKFSGLWISAAGGVTMLEGASCKAGTPWGLRSEKAYGMEPVFCAFLTLRPLMDPSWLRREDLASEQCPCCWWYCSGTFDRDALTGCSLGQESGATDSWDASGHLRTPVSCSQQTRASASYGLGDEREADRFPTYYFQGSCHEKDLGFCFYFFMRLQLYSCSFYT